MTSNLAAGNRPALTTTTRNRRHIAAALLCAAVFLLSTVTGAVFVRAGTSPGIMGNGTDGVSINIYGTYYKQLAQQTSCAYKRGGCAWFASARASELVGKDLGVHSPANWWNTYASAYGFKKTSSPVSKGFAVFSNHIVVIENVSGDLLTISEGSNPGASDAAHGYCAIRQLTRSKLESGSYKGQSFRGYIDLGVRTDNPPLEDTVPDNAPAVYVAKGSTDNKWHAFRGDSPDYNYTGIAKGKYGWWRVVSGNIDWNADSVYKNEYGWWKVTNGKVDFSFHGIATNAYGSWYLDGGKVDFSFNGELDWNGNTWTITNGKAAVKG